jgi:hypothetical protein
MLLTEHVEHEADEPMVRCKWQEQSVREDDMLTGEGGYSGESLRGFRHTLK